MNRNTKQCQVDTKYASNGITRNYENLAIAVITKAASDYRNARRDGSRREIWKLENFFRTSEWLGVLSDMDGEYILTNLQKEFDN